MSLSFLFYANDHNDVVPFIVPKNTNTASPSSRVWSTFYIVNTWDPPMYPTPFQVSFCPVNPILPTAFSSATGIYGMLHLVGDGDTGKVDTGKFGSFVSGNWSGTNWEVFNIKQMRRPSMTGLLFDSTITHPGANQGLGYYFVTNKHLTWGSYFPAVYLNHNNRANVAFADGHAAPENKQGLSEIAGQMHLAAANKHFAWIE